MRRLLAAAEAAPARRVALGVGLIGTALLVALDACVRDTPRAEDDDLIYERMAQDPFATHTYVFAFRIAVPWLVHLSPFGTEISFSVVAWLMSGAAGAVLFLLLERLGMPRRVSIPLALAFVVSPPMLVASLRQGRNPDPMTLLVMVLGALFIVERRPWALAATMVVGALNREAALFLAPFAYAVWARRPLDMAVAGRVALLAAPAVTAFVALRLAIPTVGREAVPGYGSLLGGRVDVLREAAEGPATLVRRLATVYGPLWLLAPFAFREFGFARRGVVLLALCVVAFTFALDWGRIAALAAPVVYGASAWTLTRHPRWRPAAWLACVAWVVGYAVYMQGPGMTNLIEAGPPPYPVR
jgi:hypothetical protein